MVGGIGAGIGVGAGAGAAGVIALPVEDAGALGMIVLLGGVGYA